MKFVIYQIYLAKMLLLEKDESHNVQVKELGEILLVSENLKSHWEIGEKS